jgi:hypothetical protein
MYWVLTVLWGLAACGGDDAALSQADANECGGSDAASAGRAAVAFENDDPLFRPARPDDATFCKVQMGVSTVEEVVATLGKPRFSHDSGTGNIDYTYDYAGDEIVRMTFRKGKLHDADVENMSYPACWESGS